MKSCCLLPCKVLYFDPQQQNLERNQHGQCFAVDGVAPQMHHGNHNLHQQKQNVNRLKGSTKMYVPKRKLRLNHHNTGEKKPRDRLTVICPYQLGLKLSLAAEDAHTSLVPRQTSLCTFWYTVMFTTHNHHDHQGVAVNGSNDEASACTTQLRSVKGNSPVVTLAYASTNLIHVCNNVHEVPG